MFYHSGHESFKVIEPAPGFLVRAISGENVMLCHVSLEPNSESPLHSHPVEEMAIILEGEFDMKMGDERQLLKPGDVFLAPQGVIHGGVTHEKPTVMISAFSPPRKDYA
jgi:quercetin dioxygenase-like cupin family protein